MEIFNTINEILSTSSVLYKLFFSFIEAYIGMSLFLTLLNIPATKKSKIIYTVVLPIISTIINFSIPIPVNMLINYVSAFIFIIIIFKTSPFKTLLCVFSPVILFGLITGLILKPYLTVFNITYEQLSNVPIYNSIYLLLIYFITFLLILGLKLKNFNFDLLEDIDKKNKNVILVNFIFGVITLIVQAYIIHYYINNLPVIIAFLSFISLLAYFTISIYSLTRVIKLFLTTKQLESAEEYNKTLRILHDSVRGFKHDFDNIVTTIGGYVRTNDIEGLKKYYIELEDDCQRVNNLYLLNPEIINNPRYLQSTY